MESETPFTLGSEKVHGDADCANTTLGNLTTEGAQHIAGTHVGTKFCRQCIDSAALEMLLTKMA